MKTVLLVDDDEFFLTGLVAGLSRYRTEFGVVTASNGKEARQVLESRSVDLVVTDLKMPVMDGFTLLAYIADSHPDIPVIAMSAFATSTTVERLHDLGAIELLEKPVDFFVFEERIRRELAVGEVGNKHRVTIAGLLQLLALEKKTCAVEVVEGDDSGRLVLERGLIVNASTRDGGGLDAARRILSWRDVRISILHVTEIVDRRMHLEVDELVQLSNEEPRSH